MSELPRTITSRSPGETQTLAAQLARALPPGTVLALYGELGSGKTCLVQGLARALGVTGVVNSPTYTIIHEHRGHPHTLYHVDLYRVASAREALALGIEEYLAPAGYTAIEWADRIEELLPEGTVRVFLEAGDDPAERTIRVTGGTKK